VEQVSKEWFEGRFEVVRKALLVSLYSGGKWLTV
jgi:hypothetical protein